MSAPLPKPPKTPRRARKPLPRASHPILRKTCVVKLSMRPDAVRRRQADREWVKAVRERAGYFCEPCAWLGFVEAGFDCHATKPTDVARIHRLLSGEDG